MITHYNDMIENIKELYIFLNGLEIEASIKSHLENDYLIALDFFEKYEGRRDGQQTEDGRAAFGGLNELYKWIWSVKDCVDFPKLIPHLKMLSESATRINSKTQMISPVTGKQDDKTNKLIETIVAMYAIKIGNNVDIDDPIASSGGTNPDILFTYQGKRIAIACKTLRGTSINTVLDNMKSAAKQIDRAECDIGYIAINAMNILPHDQIINNIYNDWLTPTMVMTNHMQSLYGSLMENSPAELAELFESKKIRPTILTFVHSNTRLSSPFGVVSTMLKATCVTEMITNSATVEDNDILSNVNFFIHNKL